MKSLVLTLGHNASAILIENGQIIGGIEEERLSGIKADSHFPEQAIRALIEQYGNLDGSTIYVSHWFTDGQLPESNKYWKPEVLFELIRDAEVKSFQPGFTHHDAHMLSASVFAGPDFPKDRLTFVMDGFGTYGECISIYHDDQLVDRFFGFMNSLGLFFQYATAACGMKMNNHEYKMLAYETHICSITEDVKALDDYIDAFSYKQWRNLVANAGIRHMDPMVNVGALTNMQICVTDILHDFIEHFGFDQEDLRITRIATSYFAQRHTENMVAKLLRRHSDPTGITNVIMTGGVGLNVKLNRLIHDNINGQFCATPLAGDQGAGLGVYQYYVRDLTWPGHLFWGPREFDIHALENIEGLIICDEETAESIIHEELERIGLVNIVRGKMEFGPRALCNTSTLALPDVTTAEVINAMNDRTNEMPFALVMTPDQAVISFEISRIQKSLEYMIVAVKFQHAPDQMLGGAHYYPLENEFTCRPQITEDSMLTRILSKTGPLINTSFNYHGVPIVCTTEQVIYSHEMERSKVPDLDIKTLVIMK